MYVVEARLYEHKKPFLLSGEPFSKTNLENIKIINILYWFDSKGSLKSTWNLFFYLNLIKSKVPKPKYFWTFVMDSCHAIVRWVNPNAHTIKITEKITEKTVLKLPWT